MKRSILLPALIWLLTLLTSVSFAQVPEWLWAKSAGGTAAEAGQCVAVDTAGNVYLTGYFNSTSLTFGSYTLTNAGGYDMFLVKYDAGGTVLWAKSIGGPGDDESSSIAVDASGNIYMSGDFDSPTLIFGTYTLTNTNTSYDMFLVKYDAGGNVIWATSAGGTDYDYGLSVAPDASGNVYLTGFFDSPSIKFGSYTLTNVSAGSGDVFLAKYDANGNVLWAKSAGGTDNDGAICAAVGAPGSVYITGWFLSPSITFGSYTLTNAGAYDMFIVKYDAGGNVIWAKSAGSAEDDEAAYIASDPSGNAYVTGYFDSPSLTFGSHTLTSVGADDVFLVKYDSSGNVGWATSAGGTGFDFGNSVAADASGNVYITGNFVSPSITFGSYLLTNAGSSTADMFLTKYDISGNVQWATSAGGTNYDNSVSVALDPSGDAHVSGYFESQTITFGPFTLTNVNDGTEDIFLAKINSGSGLGINEAHNAGISVYPNPVTNKIIIGTSGIPDHCTLYILNLKGQQLLQQQINEPSTTINVSTLPGGVYMIKVVGEKDVHVIKFIKQ